MPRKPEILSAIGVEGSMPRRLLALYEAFGHKLVAAEDLEHLSRLVLLFEADLGEASYRTRLTIEDLPMPPKPEPVDPTHLLATLEDIKQAALGGQLPHDALAEIVDLAERALGTDD